MSSPFDPGSVTASGSAPMANPFGGISEADEKDALQNITHMLTGTKMLAQEPGVVYSLAAQQAHPADAQAIDQFMQALDAEKAVNIARASGSTIKITPDQETLLKANGVQYADVMWTPQKAAAQVKAQVAKATNGEQTVKTNADGSLALDKNGQIQTQKTSHGSASQLVSDQLNGGGGGILDSIGGFFGHIGHDLKNWASDAAGAVGNVFSKGTNFVQSAIAPNGISNPFGGSQDITQQILSNTDYQDMKAQGYDPTSIWSTLAYDASGKKHTNLNDLNNTVGTDKVNEALAFASDPNYLKNVIHDPSNYVKNADGQTELTPEAKSKIEYLNSPEFENLVKRVNAHLDDVGHWYANAVGLDPNTPSVLGGISPDYNRVVAGVNIAASFAIDPTLVGLNMAKAAKYSQIGIDTLADREGAIAALTNTGMSARGVQRSWQGAIDLAGQIKAAKAEGDDIKVAALTSKFNSTYPVQSQILNEFLGENALTGWRNPTTAELAANPKAAAMPTFGKTDGINNMADLADWIGNKHGMLRLMNGRAISEGSLMPGTLSAFGFRKFKGLTAEWLTSRSATRAENAYDTVLSRVAANPALAEPLLKDEILMKLPPTGDDAIRAYDGEVIADRYALTPKGKGVVQFNLRSTGDVLGDNGPLARFSKAAMAARARQAVQRLTTLLPRNTVIDLNDARSSDILTKFALTYLPRGDAYGIKAAYDSGDMGQRKAIVSGLLDQVGHAAGLGHSASGRELLARMKTEQEAYANSGAEIELNGQRVGLTEGQTRMQWLFPTFQTLQKASAKIGFWDATFGRALTSDQVDSLMTQWKMGALFKPSTVTRNQLEGWLRTALDGHAGAAIKARAILTARHKELWDRGYGLEDRELYIDARGRADTLTSELGAKDLPYQMRVRKQRQLVEAKRQMATVADKPIVQHLLAKESGDEALAKQIERGSMLSGDVLGRSKTMTKLADSAPLAIVGRAWRALFGYNMDEETLQALLTIGPAELSEFMEGYGQQILAHDLGFAHAANEATEDAKAGYGSATVRNAVHRAKSRATGQPKGAHTVWTNQALDGTLGVDRYENAMARLVNAQPQTSRAVLEYIDNPTLTLDHVVKALDEEKQNTAYGSVYFENVFSDPNKARLATTPEEVAAGKRDWADKLVQEFTYMLTGRNGEYQPMIAKYIMEHGEAPSGDWIANKLTGDNLPETALAPWNLAQPADEAAVAAKRASRRDSLAQSFQDVEGAAYKHFVERPLQRTTSSPVFMAHYAEARRGLNSTVDQLVEENGLSREAAENLAKELAVRRAWVKTEQLIDDPGQKTQFDVVARNMFPFSRATQAMIRRWGSGLWANPAQARKMMLAYEGAVHTGLFYTNSYGEPTFTYPASGPMNMALRAIDMIPGFQGASQFPVASDMTGGVLMAVPGADNPFRMSMGPMVSIPLREAYKHLLPAAWQGDALKLDEFINGPVGAGETFSQFVPTAVRKYYDNMVADDRNSALVSSMNGAFANLAAAGLIPASNASPSELQQFRTRLQQQVRNQLFLRMVFGLFAPAAPSQPTEATSASQATDYAFSMSGIKGLSDEYKSILNDVHGDVAQANAVFTALHPDDQVWGKGPITASAVETGRSGLASTDAYLPPTQRTFEWLATHEAFVKEYPRLAAYFLPQTGAQEPFSDAAYKAEIEMGLRQKKTPEEFMTDVYVKHAESLFYPSVKKWDGLIAQAKLSGNTAEADQLTAQKSAWEKEFKLMNPLFGAKIDNYPNSRATAMGQLSDIRRMLKDNAVPEGQTEDLQLLVNTWDEYEKFISQHPGSDSISKQQRSVALAAYNQWAEENYSNTPLADLFNGVFRTLNTNLVKLPTGG